MKPRQAPVNVWNSSRRLEIAISPSRKSYVLGILVLFCSIALGPVFAFQVQQLPSRRYSCFRRYLVDPPDLLFSRTSATHEVRETTKTKLTMTTTDVNSKGRLIVSCMDRIGGDDDKGIQLVLASQSPRRREILDMMGLGGKYTARPSPLDETSLQLELAKEKTPPIEYTRRLAEKKAHALAAEEASVSTGTVLYLGSDTIVEVGGSILEKPKDKADAINMLRTLSGREHFVHTGVAIYCTNSKKHDDKVVLLTSFTDTATVTFTDLLEDDISAYVESGEPMDKAGSYGIQGIGGQLVSGLQGDFFTVMGLPMYLVSRALSDAVRVL